MCASLAIECGRSRSQLYEEFFSDI